MPRALRLHFEHAIYGQWLADLAADPARQKAEGFDEMDKAWAIGDPSWCRDIAASVKGTKPMGSGRSLWIKSAIFARVTPIE